jgi:hypothetical protein
MVESMRTIWYPARINGVATAKIPNGAVASELAKDGKKKTILRDLGTAISSLIEDNMTCRQSICHGGVSGL